MGLLDRIDGQKKLPLQKGDTAAEVDKIFDELIADGTMEALGTKYEVNICK